MFKKAIALILCLIISAALYGCSDTKEQSPTQQPASADLTGFKLSAEHKVIIDTDAGADDASALILAANDYDYNVTLVSGVAGLDYFELYMKAVGR